MSYPGFNLNTLVNTVSANTNSLSTISGQIIALSGTPAGGANRAVAGVISVGASGLSNVSGTIGITGIGQSKVSMSSQNADGFSGMITISGREPLFAISGGSFQNRPIILSGSGGTNVILTDVGTGVVVSFSPPTNKRLSLVPNSNSTFNHYNVANAVSGADFAITFMVPDDFNHILNMELIGIPSAAAASGNTIITYETSYGNIGSSSSSNQETVNTTYNLSGSGNILVSLPITGIYLTLSKRMLAGFDFNMTQIFSTIRYPEFIFNYR